MNDFPSTYTNGLTFKSTRNITTGDIHTTCNEFISLTGVDVEPERITGGGLVYKYDDDDKYKSLRLGLRNYGSSGQWPWITTLNPLEEWNGGENVIIPAGCTINTFLKSFHRAPPFTKDELIIWVECFNNIGLIRHGRYPTNKKLITYNKMCGD